MKQTNDIPVQNRRILRCRDVMAMTGLRRTFLLDAVRENRFPRPLKLGARAVGWTESSVIAWMDSLKPSEGGHHD